jgi:predicted Fe-Mo cluster-binding NifX family protein
MRIAIPTVNGKLSAHFGHCQQFAIIDVDDEAKKIKGSEMLTPPAHEPGVLPQWLGGMNVQIIIAGGMGNRAQQLFVQNQIQVLCGAPDAEPTELVEQYLNKTLVTGDNICDH